MNIPSILWNTIDPLVLKPDTPASYAAVEGAIAKLDCEALKSLIMEGTLASAAFWTARVSVTPRFEDISRFILAIGGQLWPI